MKFLPRHCGQNLHAVGAPAAAEFFLPCAGCVTVQDAGQFSAGYDKMRRMWCFYAARQGARAAKRRAEGCQAPESLGRGFPVRIKPQVKMCACTNIFTPPVKEHARQSAALWAVKPRKASAEDFLCVLYYRLKQDVMNLTAKPANSQNAAD